MNKKEVVTNKSTKISPIIEEPVTNRRTKSFTNDKQRGIGILELLFTAATIGTAILFAAQCEPKLPRALGD